MTNHKTASNSDTKHIR